MRTDEELIWQLDNYNTPDRTNDDQRQMSVDIHEAKERIKTLSTEGKIMREALQKIFDLEYGGDGYAACPECCHKDDVAQKALKSVSVMHDPEKTYQQLNQWQAKKIENLLAENSKQLEAFWDANKAITHLEDCMREIQAATSDKAVLDITDKALCDEPRQNQE